MPRKSLTGNKESKYAKFRVDNEVQAILDEIKEQGGNKSEFIRDLIKSNSITKKFTLFFINPKVAPNIPDEPKREFLDSLTPQEKEIIDSILEVDSNE